MSPRLRIYLAAPLFCDAEKRFNLYVRDLLTSAGYEVYLPQEQGKESHLRNPESDPAIFSRHIQALDRRDLVVAVCDGADTDSGTAWEMGYAYARGIPLIALRTDARTLGTDKKVNLMIGQSAHVVTSLQQLMISLPELLPKTKD